MEPMKPMKPMKPMEPMQPMTHAAPWWPKDLGEPSASGGQNGMNYAFFPQKRRLLIQEGGTTTAYDTGDEHITGVQQQHGGSASLAFTSQNGSVDLGSLKQSS